MRLGEAIVEQAGAQVFAPSLEERAAALNASYRDASAEAVLEAALREFEGRIAVLSSMGAEAAVSLHLVSRIDPATPVLFLDTDRHFGQTIPYARQLVQKLGLTDFRTLTAEVPEKDDPAGDLWRTNPDLCCTVRKVRPLAAVAPQFDAMITGRKRFHGGQRMRLPAFEVLDGQVRVNPLAGWDAEQVEAYFVEHDLPRHPLTQSGYRSIGCWPCTATPQDDADVRSGRWTGSEKTECGIHLSSAWASKVQETAS